MKLNFKKLGNGSPLVILHGVFGSLDNWYTLGKEFSKSFEVFLVDLRNHGQSPHADEFNYQLMSDDVVEFIQSETKVPVNLLGHSMGGKVAMELATRQSEIVTKLVVVDIGPKNYPPHHREIYEGFRSINLSKLTSRSEADQILSQSIPDFGVRQFMLKNLSRNESGGFEWKLNLNSIEKNADKIGEALPTQAKFLAPTLFIGGSNSKYILKEDEAGIRNHFPNSQVVWIEGSGHWVHAEKPNELFSTVINFLKS